MQFARIWCANLDGGGMAALFEPGVGLGFELVDPLHAGARDRLVSADDDPANPPQIVQRLERHHHLDRRAVGVRDDSPVLQDVERVDLGNDQRDIRVHAKCTRVVDDDRPGLAAIGLHSRETLAGVLDNTISTPENSSAESSRIGCDSPRKTTD